MAEPVYQTVVGFKTLPELQASVEHCAAIVQHAKALEDAATEILAGLDKLRWARDGLQVEIIKTKLLPPPRTPSE